MQAVRPVDVGAWLAWTVRQIASNTTARINNSLLLTVLVAIDLTEQGRVVDSHVVIGVAKVASAGQRLGSTSRPAPDSRMMSVLRT